MISAAIRLLPRSIPSQQSLLISGNFPVLEIREHALMSPESDSITEAASPVRSESEPPNWPGWDDFPMIAPYLTLWV